jgi:GNAT superfamily N-acetyltransferase
VIGFSTVFAPPGERFCLLEYLAVRRDLRGRGVGTGLFRQSQLAADLDGGATMLLEVDFPLPSSPDYEVATRRMAFYQRLGCMLIEALEYILPLPGEGPPPEMRLLVYRPGTSPAIGREALERWLEQVYTIVYGMARGDERIAKMMATVSDPVELGMPVN